MTLSNVERGFLEKLIDDEIKGMKGTIDIARDEKNKKEWQIQNDGDFEGLGQVRDKNERGLGEASSIFTGDSELDVIKKILDSLLGYNTKKENR